MSSPGGGFPPGTTGVDLSPLEGLSESSWRSALNSRVIGTGGSSGTPGSGFNGLFGGIGNVVNLAIEGVTTWFMHLFDGLSARQDDFEDGQIALNDRTDLLSPLLDYGSAYMNTTVSVTGGWLKFHNKIGPMQNVQIRSGANGSFTLLDKGLWDIRCQINAGSTIFGGAVDWEIRVYWPNETLYSATRIKYRSGDEGTSTGLASVVVPEPGFIVAVICTNIAPGRQLLGGVRDNRLTVQHISRITNEGETGQ